jgi:hypothetical protein
MSSLLGWPKVSLAKERLNSQEEPGELTDELKEPASQVWVSLGEVRPSFRRFWTEDRDRGQVNYLRNSEAFDEKRNGKYTWYLGREVLDDDRRPATTPRRC